MGTGTFPGLKRPGRGVNHLSIPTAEFKERVELYVYSSSGSSVPVKGWTLPFCLNMATEILLIQCILLIKMCYILLVLNGCLFPDDEGRPPKHVGGYIVLSCTVCDMLFYK